MVSAERDESTVKGFWTDTHKWTALITAALTKPHFNSPITRAIPLSRGQLQFRTPFLLPECPLTGALTVYFWNFDWPWRKCYCFDWPAWMHRSQSKIKLSKYEANPIFFSQTKRTIALEITANSKLWKGNHKKHAMQEIQIHTERLSCCCVITCPTLLGGQLNVTFLLLKVSENVWLKSKHSSNKKCWSNIT